MRWRDIRFEKPTEADGDEKEMILQLLDQGGAVSFGWRSLSGCVAWMPLSELPAFDPIPDPPEGWRFVQDGEAFDKRAQHWNCSRKQWITTGNLHGYSRDDVYVVPIGPPSPPEPQYRPYNAAELKQTIGKLVDGVSGYRAMITGACGDSVYCQGQRVPSDQLLKNHTWTDGGKCGVKVE
jgi:hypothetical protein